MQEPLQASLSGLLFFILLCARVLMLAGCTECVGSCDQKPYLHNETKGGILYKNRVQSRK